MQVYVIIYKIQYISYFSSTRLLSPRKMSTDVMLLTCIWESVSQ